MSVGQNDEKFAILNNDFSSQEKYATLEITTTQDQAEALVSAVSESANNNKVAEISLVTL